MTSFILHTNTLSLIFFSSHHYRPSALRYGQTQGLTQIRENILEEHTPENLPTEARRGGGGGGRGRGSSASRESENEEEDLSRHPYSSAETMTLFDAWISTSYDPIIGNQQTHKCFWDKVIDVYNEQKSRGTFSRNMKKLPSHFERADKDIKIFCGIYKHEAENYQSGANILRAALRVFKADAGKDFKFSDV